MAVRKAVLLHPCKTIHWIRYRRNTKAEAASRPCRSRQAYRSVLTDFNEWLPPRHAEATSNEAAHGLVGDARIAAYDDVRWLDARLSGNGKSFCAFAACCTHVCMINVY
jgi:hypothetical protein